MGSLQIGQKTYLFPGQVARLPPESSPGEGHSFGLLGQHRDHPHHAQQRQNDQELNPKSQQHEKTARHRPFPRMLNLLQGLPVGQVWSSQCVSTNHRDVHLTCLLYHHAKQIALLEPSAGSQHQSALPAKAPGTIVVLNSGPGLAAINADAPLSSSPSSFTVLHHYPTTVQSTAHRQKDGFRSTQ